MIARYGWLTARLDWLGHALRGHHVHWRVGTDPYCSGDLVCDTCQLVIWCRWYDPEWLGGRQCD